LIFPKYNDETVYIIKVKKKGSQNKKATINEGLSQIFEKKYATHIIQRNKKLKTFIIRVAYFEMKNNFEWEFSIYELKFTRENLIKAIECYFPIIDSDKISQEVEISVPNNKNDLFNDLKKFAISYFPTETIS
jgi:hypothetical protein